jgi:hypothetical protein
MRAGDLYMEEIRTNHGLLSIRIEQESETNYFASVDDPVEGRRILLRTADSSLDGARQLIVTAVAQERGCGEQVIWYDLKWPRPRHD